MSNPEESFAIHEGSLLIGGKLLQFPGLSLVKEAGRGANAVVFEAIDQTLNRQIAVKVWNARGFERAQLETTKIAQLNHPLIVSTHYFGRVEGHPYAVMEFVRGCSGKAWIKSNRPVKERNLVWRLYSRALNFIYNAGSIHGDPHLGNILVYDASAHVYGHSALYGEYGLSIKLADAGTSEFWASRGAILNRESKLIFETAKRLFADQQIDQLWAHPARFSHEKTLEVLDTLSDYIDTVNGLVDYDRRSMNAGVIVELILKTPLFNLDVVTEQIRSTGITTPDRFARRINQKLFRVYDLMSASDQIGPETVSAYSSVRNHYIKSSINVDKL
ncbi:protein kinase domain-containing protein [Azospirillum brasilense]|uniref:protein kinase domain-containing protein n=1 Tax=Azospirillum brasilense TaxID=192 RepID=UPI0013B3F070|nr:protein kinase [Azospirillum brasilense]